MAATSSVASKGDGSGLVFGEQRREEEKLRRDEGETNIRGEGGCDEGEHKGKREVHDEGAISSSRQNTPTALSFVSIQLSVTSALIHFSSIFLSFRCQPFSTYKNTALPNAKITVPSPHRKSRYSCPDSPHAVTRRSNCRPTAAIVSSAKATRFLMRKSCIEQIKNSASPILDWAVLGKSFMARERKIARKSIISTKRVLEMREERR
ncbi:uncharacterized protein LOC121246483 [Juglans microcarpa x Juglans regia]|uniref:uncharacterized protein LOC121246483 n=1 Tax=Juglans microcarpa x Juglans regia TaxID=2249226 RepID=UPI001B7DBA06|nr:uncharacterized protein LOC121246483 [Juglans microcarpa x Juglans regia]